MKKLLIVLIAAFASITANAQAGTPKKVTGITKDSLSQQPVPQVTITLLEGAKSLMNTQSSETGHFILQNIMLGNYTLAISSVGYQKKTLSLTVKQDSASIDLGVILLMNEG